MRALADSFNSMASRLQRLVDQQRSFAGDASHQLRTPLTALRLRLEQAAMSVEEGSAAEEPIEEALNETERLRHMIEGLLMLSRAENTSVVIETVDVAEIVRDRAEYWRPLARGALGLHRGRVPELGTGPGRPGRRRADRRQPGRQRVGRVTGAIRRPDTRSSRPMGRSNCTSSTRAPDCPPTTAIRAFERFWRGEHGSSGGSGLGLAIVQRLATVADGSAELRAAPGGGVEAVVTLRSP